MAQTPLTSSAEIVELAQQLEREAARLDATRAALRKDAAGTRGRWEGLVAERFRAHVDGAHRQKHLDLAHDRLLVVAKQLRTVAAQQGVNKAFVQ